MPAHLRRLIHDRPPAWHEQHGESADDRDHEHRDEHEVQRMGERAAHRVLRLGGKGLRRLCRQERARRDVLTGEEVGKPARERVEQHRARDRHAERAAELTREVDEARGDAHAREVDRVLRGQDRGEEADADAEPDEHHADTGLELARTGVQAREQEGSDEGEREARHREDPVPDLEDEARCNR